MDEGTNPDRQLGNNSEILYEISYDTRWYNRAHYKQQLQLVWTLTQLVRMTELPPPPDEDVSINNLRMSINLSLSLSNQIRYSKSGCTIYRADIIYSRYTCVISQGNDSSNRSSR